MPPRRAVDGHVGDHRHIRPHALIFRVRHTATARDGAGIARARAARFPFREGAQALEDLESTRILEMANSDLERIDTGGRRDFVEEGLVAERILCVARRANPRRRQRCVEQPVHRQLVVRQRIGNAESRVGSGRTREWHLRQPGEHGREQRHTRALERLLGHEHVGLPSGDLALVIDAGAIVEHHGRALRIPTVLVLPHPLQSHRLADFSGDHGCFGRAVVGAVAAVAARTFHRRCSARSRASSSASSRAALAADGLPARASIRSAGRP